MAIFQEQQAETQPDTTMAVMKAAEGFMMNSNHSDENCVPSSISTSGKGAGEESNTGFLENWLGEYDLNDIPSLLNVDSQQDLGSSTELDSFYFSSATGNNDIPFLTTNEMNNPSEVAPEVIQSGRQLVQTDVARDLGSVSNRKRSAAEVSEDETNQLSSSSYKTRRVISSTGSVGSSTSSTSASSSKLAANTEKTAITWTTGTRKTRKPTGFSSSSFPSIDNDDAEHFEYMSGLPPPDTSTAHIKALTGSNGAAMCFDIANAMKEDHGGTTKSIPNTVATAEMTPEEKKKVNRARNRVHARNTRIRKQCYIDELKRTLLKMLAERDSEDESKNQKHQIKADERSVRYGVLEEFLRLRTTKESDISRWNAILEDDMTLELPSANSPKNIFSGVTELMEESQENKMLGGGSFSIQCHPDTFLMEGTNGVMDWTATFADRNVTIRGTCRSSFNPQSNKLRSVALIYDSSPIQHY